MTPYFRVKTLKLNKISVNNGIIKLQQITRGRPISDNADEHLTLSDLQTPRISHFLRGLVCLAKTSNCIGFAAMTDAVFQPIWQAL